MEMTFIFSKYCDVIANSSAIVPLGEVFRKSISKVCEIRTRVFRETNAFQTIVFNLNSEEEKLSLSISTAAWAWIFLFYFFYFYPAHCVALLTM